MNNFNVLSWQNETTLSPYPLSRSFTYNNLLIDANFIQFDNFVPILNKIEFYDMYINVQIAFDKSTETITIPKSNFTGSQYAKLIYVSGRYLGKLVFGPDALMISTELTNSTLNLGIPFLAHLVKSIPSNAGVYSIDGHYGALEFTSDADIVFTVAGQNVKFDAVAVKIPSATPYLKTINSVAPISNNITISDSLIIKVSSQGASTVLFSLIGTSVANLVADQNPNIPVNHNP